MTGASPTTTPLCRHWARGKSCLYHDKSLCKFAHPTEYQITTSSSPCPLSQGTTTTTTTAGRHRSKGGRLKTRNHGKCTKLRSFIASFFSREELQAARILDVAGGKGEMAFQMLNLCGVEICHVIDPRPSVQVTVFEKKFRCGFYHRSMAIMHPEIIVPPGQTLPLQHLRPVNHLRCFFTRELWTAPIDTCDAIDVNEKHIEINDENADGVNNDHKGEYTDEDWDQKTTLELEFQQNVKTASAWTWPPQYDEHGCSRITRKEKHHSNDDDEDDDDDHNDNNNNCDNDNNDNNRDKPISRKVTFKEASSIVQQATLIVGMHPDQAVDAIVDSALELNVSFFVVPCCVYSEEFPYRRWNGQQVTKYEQLLDYLQAKSSCIQRTELPFEGKNICLYRVVR